MKTTTIFRRTALALLPAAILLGACSKTDVPTPTPAVDQGRVTFVNAAAHIAPTTLKFLIDAKDYASLVYGASSGYLSVTAGAHSVQVTAGTQTALTQQATVEKNNSYTFVATPTTSSSTVGGLLITDDLTAPATGKARIRVINLGQGTPTPLRLSQVTSTLGGPVIVNVVPNVPSNSASAFVEVPIGVANLSILDANGTVVAEVGSGSGDGSGTKKYEEGRLYTVLLTGTQGSLSADQKVKAFILTNN